LPRCQVQNLQIFLGRPFRLLDQQQIVGQPEATRREQVVAVAVVGKGPGLAHQPIDDVAVFDPMLAPTPQARQACYLLLGVPDFDMIGVQACFDPFAD
jgi:hypothetical protein